VIIELLVSPGQPTFFRLSPGICCAMRRQDVDVALR
jgi:hypothetical protein